jgi:RimJ/RimL family protein N-acetyltransferase
MAPEVNGELPGQQKAKFKLEDDIIFLQERSRAKCSRGNARRFPFRFVWSALMFHEFARDDVFRLETRRLWLRWPQAADAPAFAALAGDWDVARMTSYFPYPYARDDADQFIRSSRAENARGAALRFALTLKGGERETVGVIGIEVLAGQAMLGYWLGRPYWGRGLASEAAQSAAGAFFLFTGADELQALAPQENKASRGVLEKLGFVEDKLLKAGPGRHADSPTSRFVLRRQDWKTGLARARASLPTGPRSVTA